MPSHVLRNISEDKITIQSVKDFVQQMKEVTNFTNNPNKPNENYDIYSYYSGRTTNRTFNRNSTPTEKKFNCTRCGKTHTKRNCPAYQKICTKCGKPNHFAKMCITLSDKSNPIHNVENHYISEIFNAECNESINRPIMKKIYINGKLLSFQIDNGATTSILTKPQWIEIGRPPLKLSNSTLRNFDETPIKTLGECYIQTASEEDKVDELIRFHVVDTRKSYGLLGRNPSITNLYQKRTETNMEQVNNNEENEFLPTIKGVKASIRLIADPNKKFMKARPVPIALRAEVSNNSIN